MTQNHCNVEEDLRRPRCLAWFPVHLNVSPDHACVSHYAPDEKPIFLRSPEGARHGNSRVTDLGRPHQRSAPKRGQAHRWWLSAKRCRNLWAEGRRSSSSATWQSLADVGKGSP